MGKSGETVEEKRARKALKHDKKKRKIDETETGKNHGPQFRTSTWRLEPTSLIAAAPLFPQM